MPRLQNERQELYAKHRARGMLPNKAAMAAGYASGSSTYADLEKDAGVQARIYEIMDEEKDKTAHRREAARESAKAVGQMTGMGKAWVLTKLAEVAQFAMQSEDYKEANVALKLIGEEFGMFEGGSSKDDAGEDGPQRIDLDNIEAIMAPGEGEELVNLDGDKPVIDMELAMRLIEGNGVHARAPADKRMVTGSEADVALTDAVEVDDEDDAPPVHDRAGRLAREADPHLVSAPRVRRGRQIDPATSPEDILDIVEGRTAAQPYTPPAEMQSDRPPRRSATQTIKS